VVSFIWEELIDPPIKPNAPLSLRIISAQTIGGTSVNLVWEPPVYKNAAPIIDYNLYMKESTLNSNDGSGRRLALDLFELEQ